MPKGKSKTRTSRRASMRNIVDVAPPWHKYYSKGPLPKKSFRNLEYLLSTKSIGMAELRSMLENGYDCNKESTSCNCHCCNDYSDFVFVIQHNKLEMFKLLLKYAKFKCFKGISEDIRDNYDPIEYRYALLNETRRRGENTDYIYMYMNDDAKKELDEFVDEEMMHRLRRRDRRRACVKIQSVARMYLCVKRVNLMRCEPKALFDEEFGATRRHMMEVRDDYWA